MAQILPEQIQEMGIFTTDKNFTVLSWNSILEIMTGLKEDQVKGKNLFELFTEIKERNLDKKFINVIETGQVEFLSSVFHKYLIKIPSSLNQNGLMMQSISIAPLFDGYKIIGTIVTIRDVTKEKTDKEENKRNEIDEKTKSELIEKLNSRDWRERKDAVESLQKTTSDIIEEILIKIKNNHKNLNILNSALQVLLGHTERVIEALHSLIKSNDKDLRIYAAQTLGEVKDPEAIPILINALNDSDKNVVYHAIESLGKLKAYEAIDKLIEIALKNDFFTSFAAIDALRNMGEKILLLYIDRLIDNDIFYPILIESLRDMGDDTSIPVLLKLMARKPENVFDVCEAIVKVKERYQQNYNQGDYIIQVLNDYLNETTKNILLNSLNKQDDSKFKFLVQVVASINDEKILRSVLKYLSNKDLRKIIIQSFIRSEIRKPKLFLDQLRTADYELKVEILKALGNFTDEEVIKTLRNYLYEEDEDLIVSALNSLARIGSREPYKDILNLLKHQSNVVRRASIAALNSIGHPQMKTDIERLLYSENILELDSAIRIAGYFGYPNCLTRMIELCSHTDENIRATTLENIGFFDADEIYPVLENAIKNETTKCKTAAVKSLGFLERTRAFNLIVEALKNQDNWIKINAIRSLEQIRIYEGAKVIMDLLEDETSVPVIITALKALGKLGGATVVSVITRYINHENEDISLAAIEALGKVNHPNAIQILIEILHSYDRNKKSKCLQSLAELKIDSTLDFIKWVALTETDENLREEAINAISIFKNENAVKTLIELTSDRNLRNSVIRALSKQDLKFLYLFEKELSGENIHIKLALIEALTLMRHEKATDLIIYALNDGSPIVRIYAINALKSLGSRSAIPKINYIAKNDNDIQVRITAENFLKHLS